jgi:hypothetical protein
MNFIVEKLSFFRNVAGRSSLCSKRMKILLGTMIALITVGAIAGGTTYAVLSGKKNVSLTRCCVMI